MKSDQHCILCEDTVISGDFWQDLQSISFAVPEEGIYLSGRANAFSFALCRIICWKESRQRNRLHLYKIITLMQHLPCMVFAQKEMPVKRAQLQRPCVSIGPQLPQCTVGHIQLQPKALARAQGAGLLWLPTCLPSNRFRCSALDQ